METVAAVEAESVIVRGEAVTELPLDLYIPPDALRVFLETFQGPLDLLLYLIRKNNIDILDIPITQITQQYIEYVEVMQDMQLELAAEYLVMAATLAEIKSRMLLPRPTVEEEEGLDPRAELVRRLQEYERFKKVAEDIGELNRLERDTYVALAAAPEFETEVPHPDVSMDDLLQTLGEVLRRAELYSEHQITREVLSIRERMSKLLVTVKGDAFVKFSDLFTVEEGRMGVVVTFIAILELIRQSILELVQAEAFAPIYVKSNQQDESHEQTI
ncbi:MAG: segregation/condensation protein A [Gammaproteobacteria bacterium]|nr:segregation/condensation protein A [Gammaproteobacteria bacterium]